MELSYSHRFIFVHVYRTGGQSVSQALRPYCAAPRRPLVNRRLRSLREHNFGHIRARELKAALPPEIFDPFFKFAFVRNPWDWQVSVYHYVRQRRDHPDHETFRSLHTFDAYLDWRITVKGSELQSDFVRSESGELLVDFVGRYERLAEDFDVVCDRIGVECALPHVNRSAHGDFRDYYTSETRALVEEVYRPDIELFGYQFDP